MPTVRTYRDAFGPQRPLEPLPAVRRNPYQVVQLETPGPRPTPSAEALGSAFGEAMGRIGAEWYGQMELRHSQLEAQQGAQLLDTWELNRIDDPEKGLLATVRGEQAHTLLNTVPEEFKETAAKIQEGLKSGRARDAFQRYSGQRELEITRKLQSHVAREEETFAKAQSEATVQTAQAAAVANVLDEQRREREIDRIPQAIQTDATLHGLPQSYVDLKSNIEVSKARGMVVDAMIAKGQDFAAREYFEKYKEQFWGDQRTKFEEKLQLANTETKGSIAAGAVWDELGPKSDDSPANIDQMLDALRKALPDPKIYTAAKQSLEERYNAFNAGKAQRANANESTIWKTVLPALDPKAAPNAQPATLDEVGKMPAYLALTGEQQRDVRNAITNDMEQLKQRGRGDQEWLWRVGSQAWEEQQRARTRREQAESDKTTAAFARYMRMSSPTELMKYSEDQIINMLPTFGTALTERLLATRRSLDTPAKIKKAEIDEDLFNEVANAAGLPAYKSAGTRTQLEDARLGELKTRVLDAISQKEKGGKELSREEKKTLMKDMVDQRVMLNVWGTDPSLPAAAVAPGEAAKAYVPVSQIPTPVRSRMENMIRSNGARITDDKLSRAYAAALRGDDAALQAILNEK